MKVVLMSRGKLREPSLVERFEYYQKLLRGRLALERRHVKKGSMVAAIPKGFGVVALDERGTELTSVALSKRVGRFLRSGTTGLALFIGAADGLLPDERARADETWSLSRLTLPHQLCFAVLAEQLYRATTILRGEKYHRD